MSFDLIQLIAIVAVVVGINNRSEDDNQTNPNDTNHDTGNHEVSGTICHVCGTNHISFTSQSASLKQQNKKIRTNDEEINRLPVQSAMLSIHLYEEKVPAINSSNKVVYKNDILN